MQYVDLSQRPAVVIQDSRLGRDSLFPPMYKGHAFIRLRGTGHCKVIGCAWTPMPRQGLADGAESRKVRTAVCGLAVAGVG